MNYKELSDIVNDYVEKHAKDEMVLFKGKKKSYLS